MFFKILCCVVLIGLVSTSAAGGMEFAKSHLQIIGKNGKHDFNVEIADVPEKHERGLMFRKHMPENSGMIFLFTQAHIVNMWMKDTYIPLDMVFIKNGGKIVKIVANSKPMSVNTISSDEKIVAVLELNSGICEKLDIKKNDTIVFQGLQ
jgi:hypothetical protein